MNDFIDIIEEKGNEFIDKVLKPLAKGSKDIFINDNKIINSFLTFKTAFMENKLLQYIEFINQNQNEKTIDFIENLGKEEKTFFIEAINKVIDLDDSLQIFILAYLTNQFKENLELNYYEKQLFYNINSLSEDDFKIFYCMYNDNITDKKQYMYIQYAYMNKDIIEISLNKFSNIGLLKIKPHYNNDKKDNISSSNYYYTTEYSKNLFDCLKNYFSKDTCPKLLEKKKQTATTINLSFL